MFTIDTLMSQTKMFMMNFGLEHKMLIYIIIG